MQALLRLGEWLLGRFPGSTLGSRWRRAFSFVALLMILLLAVETALAQAGRPGVAGAWVAAGLAALAVVYFLVVLVAVFYLSSHEFRVDPLRLAHDGVLSALLMIFSFATLYRELGLSLGPGCDRMASPVDAVYFSAVTFTTLGYGDLRPCPLARLPAAMQALLGTLHLGIIVGAAFFLADGTHRRPETAGSGDQPPQDGGNKDGTAAEHHDRGGGHEAVVGPGAHARPPSTDAS